MPAKEETTFGLNDLEILNLITYMIKCPMAGLVHSLKGLFTTPTSRYILGKHPKDVRRSENRTFRNNEPPLRRASHVPVGANR